MAETKSPGMVKSLDDITASFFGRTRTDSIINGICVTCGESEWTLKFRDELSRKEYAISGMCQKCQDSVFGYTE